MISVLAAMFLYNFTVGAYFAWLSRGELVGALLWPAAVVHVIFAVLLALALSRSRLPPTMLHKRAPDED